MSALQAEVQIGRAADDESDADSAGTVRAVGGSSPPNFPGRRFLAAVMVTHRTTQVGVNFLLDRRVFGMGTNFRGKAPLVCLAQAEGLGCDERHDCEGQRPVSL